MARLGGPAGYDIIQYALTALERLTHRGGVDADGASGDGAGLLTSLPEEFFRARAKEQGIELAETFGLGFAFFAAHAAADARSAIEAGSGERAAAHRGMAARSRGRAIAGPAGIGDDAGNLAIFRGGCSYGAHAGAIRAAAGDAAQTRGSGDAGAMLCVLAVVAHGGLQGAADAEPVPAIL